MNLIIFSEYFFPYGSGAELATYLYVKGLVNNGINVTIVTDQMPELPILKGVNIIKLPLNASNRYSLYLSTLKHKKMITKLIDNSDIVYIPASWYGVLPIAKKKNKPIVTHIHNYSLVCPTSLMYNFSEGSIKPCKGKAFMIHEIIEKKRNGLLAFMSMLLNETIGMYYNKLPLVYSDKLIFVSNKQYELTEKYAPIKDKSEIIYNPIPEEELLPIREKNLGYFGGNRYTKGIHILLDSLKYIKTNVDAYFTNYPYNDTLKIGNVKVNLLNRLEENKFNILYESIGIVVVPSLFPEPAPYVVIRSMLRGRVVVASAIGGIPEITNSNNNHGVKLFDIRNNKKLAEYIEYFISMSKESIIELGIKNRELILSKFNNERSIKRFISVLENAI